MTARTTLIGLAAVAPALAGCVAGEAPAPSVESTPQMSATATAESPESPPAAAQLPCGDETRSQVQQALGITSVPPPESGWADNRHTCSYQTPMGQLVYSVTVEPTREAAEGRLEVLRAQLGATRPVAGMQQAYKSGAGTVVALVDSMVLSVDATALPREHLGPEHQTRTGLAIVLATGVIDSWTGQD
jgi:hypothetical protein